MLLATLKIEWTPSISADVKEVRLRTTIDGVETAATVTPDAPPEIVVEARAKSAVTFQGTVVDRDGLEAPSVTYSFTLGDLERPQPITGISHKILSIREVPDPEPTPAPTPEGP